MSVLIPRGTTREIQAAFESVQRDLNALGGGASVANLAARLNVLTAQLQRIAQQIRVVEADIAALLAIAGTFVAGESIAVGDPVYESSPGIARKTTTNTGMIETAFLGVSAQQAAAGATFRVARQQAVEFGGWNWNLGAIYLGASGELTESPTDFVVGVAVSPTVLEVRSYLLDGLIGFDNTGTGGVGVLEDLQGGILYARSLVAGTNVVLTENADTISISAPSVSGPENPDSFPAIPNVADDEFQYGSGLDTTGSRAPSAVPWTWVNQGGATAVQSGGILVLNGPATTGTNVRLITQPVSGTWKYRCKLNSLLGTMSNHFYAGIIARNTANGRLVYLSKIFHTSAMQMEYLQYSNLTTVNFALLTNIFNGANYSRAARSPLYLEIENDGTNLHFRYSDVGIDGTFATYRTELVSSFMGDVDQIGLSAYNTNNNPSWGAFDWFRRVA